MKSEMHMLENPYFRSEPTGRIPGSELKKMSPWKGLLFFVIDMILFMTLGALVQYFWGIYGVAVTELGFLGISIAFVKICRVPLREVFPLKKPRLMLVGATLVLWAGAYLATNTATMILGCFFPEQLFGTNHALTGVIVSAPFLISFIIVAVMPAVCEEAMHRGVILSSMKIIRKDWVLVLLMGVIFGIFHMDPIRFLPTALLGAMLSYLMIKTNNLIYPGIFHMINNAYPLLVSFWLMSVDPGILQQNTTVTEMPVITLAGSFIWGSVSPFLIYTGAWMLKRGVTGEKIPYLGITHRVRKLVILAGISGGCFVTGSLLAIYSVLQLWT